MIIFTPVLQVVLKCQKSGRFTPENCHRHPKYICHLTNCTSINPLRPRRVPLVQEIHVKLPLRNCGALMTRLLQPQTKRVRSDLKYSLASTRSAFRLPASSPLRLPASKWALTKNSVMANLNLNFNTKQNLRESLYAQEIGWVALVVEISYPTQN